LEDEELELLSNIFFSVMLRLLMKASVIVPTYKRTKFLLDTIKSIIAQKCEGQFEIVVVDNSPSIELFEQVKELSIKAGEKPVVRYIEEPSTGLHFARHAGARAANAELLIFCDDDILARDGWLNSILAPFSNPSVVCVGGKVMPHWEVSPPSWVQFVPEGYYSLLDYGNDPHIMRADEWFNGCNFAIRKGTLFELGGFNPDGFGDRKLIWHRGDGEYGLMRKIRERNYKVMHAPEAAIEHRIGSDRMKLDYLRRRAFNFGIEASYSHYRYHNPSQIGLVLRMPKLIAGYLLYQFRIAINKNSDEQFLRCLLRRETYRGNLLHNIRLLMQRELRKFCQRKNYLEARH
jgi:glucosyl-dolichyl phosphate glucuronosyltransferase